MKFYLVLLVILLITKLSFSQTSTVNPNGYNVFYFEDGEKSSEGNLKEGKPEGYWKTYSKIGYLKTEGNRKEFLLDSVWKFYSDSGQLEQTINYKENLKEGKTVYYSNNGKKIREIEYVAGKKMGKTIIYHENGIIKKEDNYKNGIVDGVSIEYDTLGRKITIENYVAGIVTEKEKINRLDESGNKTGIWKEYHKNGQLKWVGNYTAGKVDGIIREYSNNGKLKEIKKFNDGEIQENAQELIFIDLTRTYHPNGNIHFIGGKGNNMKQGMFREFDSVGILVNCKLYRNDTLTAEGLIDTTGTYIGLWKYLYEDGKVKNEGKYLEGKRDGLWTYYFNNGKIEQKGKYKNGKPSGLWRWYYTNNQLKREESFRNGREDGESIEFDSIGNILTKGEYIDGLREGSWFYDVGDHTEEGAYSDGEMHGEWKHYYSPDSEKKKKLRFIGEYRDGQPIEKHKFYYFNGQVKEEGKYRAGLKNGEWKKFNEEGEIILTILYKNGEEYKLDGFKLD